MSKTNSLRKFIIGQLKPICERSFWRLASDKAMFPHIVASASMSRRDEGQRDSVTVDIDIWTKNEKEACEMADAVCAVFDLNNAPQPDILPTSFVENVKDVVDEDKDIIHKSIEVTIQNYER